jgi:hypothetical protein
MIRPQVLRALALLLFAACAPVAATPAPAPTPPPATTCEAPSPPPPVASARPATPVCRERSEALSSCGQWPGFELGESGVCAASCVGAAASTADHPEEPARCTTPPRRAFAICDAATIARAISVADFLQPTAPTTGSTVFVKGRLGPGGLHDTRKPSPIGLISDRDYGGLCLLAHLAPKPGEAANRWLCSPPPPGERSESCCNEDPSRPLTGQEIVVRATVAALPIGAPTLLFGIVHLVPETLCIVRKHP